MPRCLCWWWDHLAGPFALLRWDKAVLQLLVWLVISAVAPKGVGDEGFCGFLLYLEEALEHNV